MAERYNVKDREMGLDDYRFSYGVYDAERPRGDQLVCASERKEDADLIATIMNTAQPTPAVME